MRIFNLASVGTRISLMMCLLFFVGSVFGQEVAQKEALSTIPGDIVMIVKPSCMPCHSNTGKDKPKAAVNFSVWDLYTSMEKTLLSGSIKEEVEKKGMPPKRFLESHPENALTDAQIAQIVQWCNSFKAKP